MKERAAALRPDKRPDHPHATLSPRAELAIRTRKDHIRKILDASHRLEPPRGPADVRNAGAHAARPALPDLGKPRSEKPSKYGSRLTRSRDENLPPQTPTAKLQQGAHSGKSYLLSEAVASRSTSKHAGPRPQEGGPPDFGVLRPPLTSRPQNQTTNGMHPVETAAKAGPSSKYASSKSPRVARETYSGFTQDRIRQAAAGQAEEVRQVSEDRQQLAQTARRREDERPDGRLADLQTREDAGRRTDLEA